MSQTHTQKVCMVQLQIDRTSSSVSFARNSLKSHLLAVDSSGGDVRGTAWKRSPESRESKLLQIPELFFSCAAAGLGSACEETGAAIFAAVDLLTCRSLKDAHM